MRKRRLLSLILSFVIAFSFVCYAEDVVVTDEASGSTETANEEIPENVGKVIWVDASFKGGNGSKEAPYATIQQAQSGVSKLSAEEKQKGVLVMIKGGDYVVSDTIVFSSADSGTSVDFPVIYQGYGDDEVIIKGTQTLSKSQAKKVTSSDVAYQRLQKSVRNKIYVYDINQAKFKDLGKNYYAPSGDSTSVGKASFGVDTGVPIVLYNNLMMQNSVYPNIGEKFVGEVAIDGNMLVMNADSSSGEKEKMATWTNITDGVFSYITRHGYRRFFAPMINGKIDSGTNKIHISLDYLPTTTVDRPERLARYEILNLIEEIDVAGEWAIDYTNKKLYFLPTEENFGDLEIAMLTKPIISMEKAENITLKNITLGYGRNNGLNITDCKNVVIDGCRVKYLREKGIVISGLDTNNVTLKNSTIAHTSNMGLYISDCGKKANLQKSNVFIDNNEIFDVATLASDYDAVTLYNTVGVEIVHNRIHNVPGIGIIALYNNNGNPGTVIENNELYDVTNKMIDLGAIYIASASNWGTSVSNNYIHDCIRTTPLSLPVNAIYLDSDGSGYICRNNIIQNVTTHSFHCNGGDANIIENNIAINSGSGMLYSSNRASGWSSATSDDTMTRYMGPSKEYLDAFPTLAYLSADKGKPEEANLPKWNTIKNNVAMDCGTGFTMHAHVQENANEIKNNKVINNQKDLFDFKDIDNYDLSFTENARIFEENPEFKHIDFESMGLKEEVKMEKPTLVAPYNGEKDVDVYNTVFRWYGGTHNKYRVVAALDENFYSKVLDEVVTGTTYSPKNFRYGNIKYYWKVIPLRESKSDKDEYVESEVYSFTTLKDETVNKNDLRALIKKIGTGYANFDGYSSEAIETMREAYTFAKAVNDGEDTKQVHVRTVIKRLEAAQKVLYDSVAVDEVSLNSAIADTENWITPEGTIKDGTKIESPDAPKTRQSIYTGKKFAPNQVLKFKLMLNYTNWQGIGFRMDPFSGKSFWSDICYFLVIRDGSFEVQRYNYDDEGKLTGGIINQSLNFYTKSGEYMDCEFSYTEVHNGIRILLKVNGVVAVDYVDTSSQAVFDNMYFTFHDGSTRSMGVKAID